ncbi:ATP-binding protein [Zavarzinia compransoris]|uniref:sensor histidine kinase n=1 Tax=Zavarzinia marina TaxID=2911065 RepID=UPI001F3EEFC4|nr:histidine kinase dimerization/phosphoacceptor domain -containing protein [Zavarzinia marina]MCF4166438.1 ATP-binding protein [Zavarzinia marina]
MVERGHALVDGIARAGRKPRTILLSIIVLLFGAGIFTWASLTWAGHDRALSQARDEARLLSRVVDEHFQWTIKGSDLVLRQAVEMVADDGLDSLFATETKRLRLISMARLLPQIGSLWFFDDRGRVVYSTSQGRTPPADFADRDFFKAHQNGADFFITPANRSRLTDTVYFSVSRRLMRGGRFAGVVLAAIDMRYFAAFHGGLRVPSTTALELFRTDGRLVVRWPINDDMVGRDFLETPFFRDHLAADVEAGAVEAPAIVGDAPSIIAYRRIKGLPLVTLATIDREAAFADWRADTAAGLVFILLAGGLIGGLTLFGLRAIDREEATRDNLAARTVELEEALASRTLLFKEMHHRTKNNLQIVSSLLSLQAGQYGDPSLRQGFTDTVNRIRAMAQLHEQLYQGGEITAVDCGAFLRSIGESLTGEGASRGRIDLDLDLESVSLPMDRAVPLALIANELLTNALKHGFAEGRGGRIRIALRRTESGIELVVADDGAGFTEETAPSEKARSLGMRLIRGLALQLKGTVDFASPGPGQGTTACLRMPA